MAAVYTVTVFDVNVRDCVFVCLFVCLFQFCCLFVNLCLCLKWNLISVLYCVSSQRGHVSIFVRVCLFQLRSLFDAVSFYREVI